jgi:hypothetical protein
MAHGPEDRSSVDRNFSDGLGPCLFLSVLVVAILTSLVALLPVSTAQAAEANRHAVAVIIGNRNYDGRVPDVKFAYNDADAMKKYVTDVLGYRDGNILDMRDATQADMVDAFGNDKSHEGKLFDWVRPGKSDVLVFYSGHGVPGMKDKKAYLLPVGGNPNKAEITGYSVDTLYKNLAKIPARSVVVFLDACFSGETSAGMVIKSASGLSIVPQAPSAAASVVSITAARGDQLASWDEDAGMGLFTRYLLQGLYGEADGKDWGNSDGQVTLQEVREYLSDEMTYQARRRFGRRQNASFSGQSDMVLAHTSGQKLQLNSRAVREKPKPVVKIKPKPKPKPQKVAVARPVKVAPKPVYRAPVKKGRPVLGQWIMRLEPMGSICALPWLEERITLRDSGFVWTDGGVQISGELDRRYDLLEGTVASQQVVADLKLTYDGRSWSGHFIAQVDEWDCEGVVTLSKR